MYLALRQLLSLSPISPSPSPLQRQSHLFPPYLHGHFASAAKAVATSHVPADFVHEQRQNTVYSPRTAASSVAIVGVPAATIGGNFANNGCLAGCVGTFN